MTVVGETDRRHAGRTERMAAALAGFRSTDLPGNVLHEARRALVDWIGCVMAGRADPDAAAFAAVLADSSSIARPLSGGRAVDAAMIRGFAAHVLDFDDMAGTGPVFAALFAHADRAGLAGIDLLAAYVAGIEAGGRTAAAAPDHHRAGWHPIGTIGSIAAGAAVARAMQLTPQQFAHAIGFAANQAAGMQRNRGTPGKPLNAARAAANGLLAASLASAGFEAGSDSLDGVNGFCRMYSEAVAPDELTNKLLQSWKVEANAYKPYPCGAVLHPVIDAVLDLRRQGASLEALDRLHVRISPLAARIAAPRHPESPSRSKFSAEHVAALALADGKVDVAGFSEGRVGAADIVALRDRIFVEPDPALQTEQAAARFISKDGRQFVATIQAARGSSRNPMTDRELSKKLIRCAAPAVGAVAAKELCRLAWHVETLSDVRALSSGIGCG